MLNTLRLGWLLAQLSSGAAVVSALNIYKLLAKHIHTK